MDRQEMLSISTNETETDGLNGLTRSQKTSATGKRADTSFRITTPQVRGLLERSGKRCQMTGQALTPETASLDHIMPVSRGGAHTIDNCQIIHQSVNAAKGSMTNDEFVAMCCSVADYMRSRPKSTNGVQS